MTYPQPLTNAQIQAGASQFRFLTQVVPFMNARIQGLYKLGRAAKEDPARFAAVIGDLAESLIKRSCSVKDSGRFLPGIGGALDLIDSILFTAPMMFFYLRFVMR